MPRRKNERRRLFQELAELYQAMQTSYDEVASKIGLSCTQCTDNCCVSYFQHHTYIEWAYSWEGLKACGAEKKDAILTRAQDYMEQARESLRQNRKPKLMCPVNEYGWCLLYDFRLMICRLHGVPNVVRMPDASVRFFPGCEPCQELTRGMAEVARMDRTLFYHRLAELEKSFLGPKYGQLPKVNLTLADMIVQGPPRI